MQYFACKAFTALHYTMQCFILIWAVGVHMAATHEADEAGRIADHEEPGPAQPVQDRRVVERADDPRLGQPRYMVDAI